MNLWSSQGSLLEHIKQLESEKVCLQSFIQIEFVKKWRLIYLMCSCFSIHFDASFVCRNS